MKLTKTLKSLFFIIKKRDKYLIIFLIISSLVISLVDYLTLFFVAPLLGYNLPEEILSFSLINKFNILNDDISLLLILIGSLIIIKNILNVLFYFATSIFVNFLSRNLIYELTKYYKMLNISEFLLQDKHSYFQKIFYECEQTIEGGLQQLIIGFKNLFIIFIIFYFLIFSEILNVFYPSLILILVCGILIYLLSYIAIKTGEKRLIFRGELIKKFSDYLSIIFDIKFLKEKLYFENQIKKTTNKLAQAKNASIAYIVLPKPLLEVFVSSSIILVSLYHVNNNLNFSEIFPTLILFLLALFRLGPTLMEISRAYNVLMATSPSINLIYKEYIKLKKFNEKGGYTKSFDYLDSIKLKNVEIKYQNKTILKNINLEILKNKSYGFYGESGSGKTSLVNIISNLLNINKGEYLVNGISMINENIDWNNKLMYIRQNPSIINASISENIALGINPNEIDKQKVERLLKMVKLNTFLSKNISQINSNISDLNEKISGGEKQRIAIARALYFNPDILICDEITASLDDYNEQSIMEIIENLKGDKTIIFISHKIKLLEKFDHIYKVENGELVNEK